MDKQQQLDAILNAYLDHVEIPALFYKVDLLNSTNDIILSYN